MKDPKYIAKVLRDERSSRSIEDRLRDKLEKAEQEILKERRRAREIEDLLSMERQIYANLLRRVESIFQLSEGRPVNGRG